MKTLKNILVVVFFFSLGINSFGQGQSVLQLDNTPGGYETDQIYFLKDHQVDTVKSKTILDSITWFMAAHPTYKIEVEVTADKKSAGAKESDPSAIMSQRVADYLIVHQPGNSKNLVASNYRHDPPRVSDENFKKTRKTVAQVTKTRFRIIARS